MNFISDEVLAYAEKHSSVEPPLLADLNRETHVNHLFPRMLSGHLQGRFLSMVSKMMQPENILEIGTYTGYSAICLAEGLSENGILHSIELNDENEKIIRKYILKAGYENRILLHFGDALKIIPEIDENFDLVFLDADKENYVNYYHLLIGKLRKGGIILADNAFWSGKVLDANIKDKETVGIRNFNDLIANDHRVDNIFLTIRDGIMMIMKK